ncbi:hypothetical protein BANRA_05196 [Klebsiella pneumoniae]|nr:hypothetical protein BANRA_05196 [Klebsiella pneumoniae]
MILVYLLCKMALCAVRRLVRFVYLIKVILLEGLSKVLTKFWGIFDKITEGVDVMKSIALTKEEQRLFGQAALTYRYEDENKSPVSIEQIIHPRRYEDKKMTSGLHIKGSEKSD